MKVIKDDPSGTPATRRLIEGDPEQAVVCIHGRPLSRAHPGSRCDACRAEMLYDGESGRSRRLVESDDGYCVHDVPLDDPCTACHTETADEANE
jgi:hypothetical protein